MLARFVEVGIKGGKKKEVARILQNQLVPLLQAQPGFVAYETLSRTTDPNLTTSITYWQSQDDADRCYSLSAYDTIVNQLRPLLSNEIRPVLHHVEISTTQRIAAGKAA